MGEGPKNEPPIAVHRLLLAWYRRNARDLPWRRTRDFYPVWVSEIMLQQTRVETVIPYYERFLNRYPNVAALAAAPQAELLEAWAGLGYYRRARHLHAAARQVAADGRFPKTFAALRALPGVGDYTAAAVSSIAFELPHVVVDGNVLRVVSRLLDDPRDVSKTAVRKAFEIVAQSWMDPVRKGGRGDFNQALMELGAVVCTPKSPRCSACPLRANCLSFRRGTQSERPVKTKREKLRRVVLSVAVVARGSSLIMRRRPDDEGIMPGFWELPQAEGPPEELTRLGLRIAEKTGEFRHSITVRSFHGSVYPATLQAAKPADYRWVTAARRSQLPLTTITRKALKAYQGATSPE